MAHHSISHFLPTGSDTDDLGRRLSDVANAGDCILLQGQIGAGKSALARAFIRARLGEEIDVPSPTFTLVQTYDVGNLEIWHADLYRLSDTSEAIELGLLDAMDTQICLIEWPEILAEDAPKNALWIELLVEGDGRRAELKFGNEWTSRLAGILGDA